MIRHLSLGGVHGHQRDHFKRPEGTNAKCPNVHVPFPAGVELNAWVGAAPGGVGDLVPKITGAQSLRGLGRPTVAPGLFLFRSPVKVPLPIALHALHEGVVHAHGIIAVLARHREVGA